METLLERQSFWAKENSEFKPTQRSKLLNTACVKNTHGVMVKAMDCGIFVSEFVLQSRYYLHFRANTLGKCMNPLILPAMGWIVPLLFFKENSFGIK